MASAPFWNTDMGQEEKSKTCQESTSLSKRKSGAPQILIGNLSAGTMLIMCARWFLSLFQAFDSEELVLRSGAITCWLCDLQKSLTSLCFHVFSKQRWQYLLDKDNMRINRGDVWESEEGNTAQGHVGAPTPVL